MPRRRTSANECARLFAEAARPIYLLDGAGRVVFLNAACAAWLGADADVLVGARCRYGVAESGDAATSLAAGLCPPPEVFQGQRATVQVARRAADGTFEQRDADCVPFALAQHGRDEQAVLVIVREVANLADEAPPSDDPRGLHAALQRAQSEMRGRYRPESLVGRSSVMRRVRRQVQFAAAAERTPVLIHGPAGSGRQHVARAIHYAQRDPLGPFVPLACATLSAELIASGISALAATAEREGQGTPTLFLRDVELLTSEAQEKLAARVVGGRAPWRWMATSSVALDELSQAGKFHPELANLFSTLAIRMPSFTERAEDLPLVAQAFLEEVNARGGKQLSGFTPETLDLFAANPPRGGWDELAEWVREAHERATGVFIDRAALPDRVRYVSEAEAYRRPAEETIDLEKFLAEIELELIERALAKAKGNKTKAAELLSMNRPKFYRRLEQLGLGGSDE
jgi:DNA-binding NtrC family response regulator